jgi:predicted nicotinamide N-methyase
MFAILAPAVGGARVLDGFAGSGALGIEALSRGAASVVFVDEDARAAALIGRNLAHCRIAEGYVMIRAEFTRALRQLATPPEHVAVVLAANPDGLLRGTRANANGVDLNRNFPASNWRAGTVTSRATIDAPSDVVLSTGTAPASEPETQALPG